MSNNIEKATNLLDKSEKEFITSQTRLFVSQLDIKIIDKLRHANEVSMNHPKVSEILQLKNFSNYPLLQKSLNWRYSIIDKQNWSDKQKKFYKQVLLAKALLSVSLRNIGEQSLAKEIDFSKVNAQNFQKAAQNNTLESHIFSGSYLKCLHAFQKNTQKDEDITINKRSKADAVLGYKTVQQLLSYAHYTVSNPIAIDQEFKREYVTGKIDYSNPTIVQNKINNLIKTSLLGSIDQTTGNRILSWVRSHPELMKDFNINDKSSIDKIVTSMTANYCIQFISLSDSQKILQSLNKYAANTNSEIVDTIINPYRKELIDHMLKLGASQSHLDVVQNINNIKSTIDSSIDMKKFEIIGNQYRQNYLKNKSEQYNNKKNPYLTSPFNPRNYINPKLTKRGDQLFHKGFHIDEKMEQHLYGQKRGDPLFIKGIIYTVIKDGIFNMPDDILMFVGDIVALGSAAMSGQGLLFKYLGARRNADSDPQAAQDLAWMIEAHPILGLLNLLSRQTIKGLRSQMRTIMKGKGTAKEIGDFINMIGGLLVGGAGVIKVGGKMVQFGAKLAKSEKVSRVAQTISKVGSKVANVGSKIDPANVALSGAGAAVGTITDAIKGSTVQKVDQLSEAAIRQKLGSLEEELRSIQQDNHPRITKIDAEMKALEKALKDKSNKSKPKKPKEIIPEKLKPITSESELIDAQKLLNQEIVRGVLSAEEIGRRLGYFMAQFHDLLKRGVIISKNKIFDIYLWIKDQYSKLTNKTKQENRSQMKEIQNEISKQVDDLMRAELGSAELAKIQDGFRNLDDIQGVLKSLEKLTKWTERHWLSKYVSSFGFEILGNISVFGRPVRAEILFNMYCLRKQVNHARRFGMNWDSIMKMIKNHAYDTALDLPYVSAITWLLGLDMKHKANTKNAQEFLKLYGQEIENLKKMGASIEELKPYQKEFDRLKIEFDISSKTIKNTRELRNAIESAKNLNELKSIIMEKLPSQLKGVQVGEGYKVNLTKQQIRNAIDAYLTGQTNQLRNIPEAYGLRDMVEKLSKANQPKTKTQSVI